MNNAAGSLENYRAPTNVRLALMWASLMFLYIYNDYFSMYTPGTIEDMMAGRMGPLGEATTGVFVGVSMLLAVPALMSFLSVALPPAMSRWLNVLLGLIYTAVEAMTLRGTPLFFQIVVVLEIGLTLLIVWSAVRWPKQA